MGETSGLLAGGSEGGGGCDTSGGSRSGLNSAERKGFGRWRAERIRRYFGPRLWFREDACEKKCGFTVREGHVHFVDINPVSGLYRKWTHRHLEGQVARLCRQQAGTCGHQLFGLDKDG
ncbi:ubiquitin-protein ligase [Culex quinquefasciatus]|uniref:Ubiquitin-protein ligase n=1 Tax=Culex quinquefasciatus TaxID=7176 RepID=B0XD24_CULQU|nr:ubiquitin-protein ligase [Culex quinquefasciatus]|eukprot:XP_001867546.1 ubiquitin-protein ligase [Culex quinquefasciatus]